MKIIAHRGASGLAPENTLKAMTIALSLGVEAIEIDVQEADGELWVFHDRRLERCSDGEGVLSEHSQSYLASLNAGEGEAIPTLWQVMALITGRCELHIELKGVNTAKAVAALTQRAEAELGFTPEQWVVSSFHHPELARFAKARPEIRLGALTASLPLTLAQFAEELGAWSINCDVDFIDQALIDDAHARGLQVLVYTVDHPLDQQRLAQQGVDGIFTNRPDRLLAQAHS
ncbi:glycerophosphodiester phosphodiesterase [Aeromonas cavernicola]|uniref:Glycerophosphodiester phosphodiesterase n=1 Tax=Aeromonas cavernicola TaxID=1006623 RepID=A0A2H9U512_9GAMM|nr:glycerophosphodiester phosphodiesterase [Aeromonas cavernicola]PJG59058.1 glycerophosphodiester phosphodiesterase [Aeromonas cavernicola]